MRILPIACRTDFSYMKTNLHAASLCAAEALSPEGTARTEVTDLRVDGLIDPIFPAEGAHPYLRDLPQAELHLLDTGHFALEEDGARMAEMMRRFLLENAPE